MANVKANENKATSTAKLLSKSKIDALISDAVKTTAKGLALIHVAAVQCMLHAEKHGDVTLAARLVQEVKDNCKGVVVAGLNKWFKDHSPIKLATDEDGKVVGSLLKEGEPGYKPFASGEAETHVAMEAREVTARTDRPIEPFSIALVKQRIASLKPQLKKATEEGGRGIVGDARIIEVAIDGALKGLELALSPAVVAGTDKDTVKPQDTIGRGRKAKEAKAA